MEEDKAENLSAHDVPLPEVSLKLQHSREAKGISLREAEAATRIPVHYLQLLEGRGDTRVLADALYLVPFLRTYALFLGLDPSETVVQFIQSVHGKEDTVSSLAEHVPPARLVVSPLVIFIAGVCVVLLILLWVIRSFAFIPWQ
jgi:cytoskeletal protein RodZ